MSLLSTFRRWFPAMAVMGLIFLASAVPSAQMPDAGHFDLIVKKGGHFTGYALLMGGYLHALRPTRKRGVILALLLCAMYAVSDEIHQSFVSGRHPSPLDVGIDLLGSGLAAALFLWVAPLRKWVLQ